MSEITVLCVARESELGQVSDLLGDQLGVSVLDAVSLDDAEETLSETDIDCLVTEYDLPDGTGIELIRRVRTSAPSTGCILYTDAEPRTIADEADSGLVTEYVDRDGPVAADRLVELVTTTGRLRTQTAYPLPENESERLAVLDALDFDAPSLDRAFNRITELAAHYFDVDRATVNVIDEDTQEVLASHGTDWTSLPREDTICTYSILDDDVTVVPDTSTDPRFEDNDDLDDMDVHFYAGVPLTTSDGLPIGTLCIYDEETRELSDEDRQFLELLADETMHWVSLHSRLDQQRTVGSPTEGS